MFSCSCCVHAYMCDRHGPGASRNATADDDAASIPPRRPRIRCFFTSVLAPRGFKVRKRRVLTPRVLCVVVSRKNYVQSLNPKPLSLNTNARLLSTNTRQHVLMWRVRMLVGILTPFQTRICL